MGRLSKDATLFKRDGEGNLLPVEVALETYDKETTILCLPLTEGQLAEVTGGAATAEKYDDAYLISKYCVDPKYSFDEIKVMKNKVKTAIVVAIMATSLDIEQEELQKIMLFAKKNVIADPIKDEFEKKKDLETKED